MNRYPVGEKWADDKVKLSSFTDFPNLPYIRKGDYVLTESSAIIQYICFEGMRFDLIGSNP